MEEHDEEADELHSLDLQDELVESKVVDFGFVVIDGSGL